MQSPAGPQALPTPHPDLPHTCTRPVHWIATAAALAAVLGVSALVQPLDAIATPPSSTAAGSPEGPPVDGGPDPAKARFPVDCGGQRTDVIGKGSSDLDGDGRPETVAVVRCHSGIGTPPSGVYVLAHPAAGSGAPQILEMLLDPEEGLNVTDFAVHGRTISATLLGYSSQQVPRCCPDKQRQVNWRWGEGKFRLTALAVAESV